MSSAARSRVLVVDDHGLVRLGLRNLIHDLPDFMVCGEAETQAEAVSLCLSLNPDLVLLDLQLPDGGGLSMVERMCALRPRSKLLVLSMHDERTVGAKALALGAAGYLMKGSLVASVVEAMRSVVAGNVYASPALAQQIVRQAVGGGTPDRYGIDTLSPRELSIFQLIGAGRTTKEIAEQLHLSVKTVETHRAHIREKLALHDGRSLAHVAAEWAHASSSSTRRAPQADEAATEDLESSPTE